MKVSAPELVALRLKVLPPTEIETGHDGNADLIEITRITAKRLLAVARAAGYEGSARNFRRLVADEKAQWRALTSRTSTPRRS